jgi:hypothetical protein
MQKIARRFPWLLRLSAWRTYLHRQVERLQSASGRLGTVPVVRKRFMPMAFMALQPQLPGSMETAWYLPQCGAGRVWPAVFGLWRLLDLSAQ